MKYLLSLILLTQIFACQNSNTVQSINELVDENVEICLDGGDRFLNGIEKNYLENKRKVGPFYKYGMNIDSASKCFFELIKTYDENENVSSYDEIFSQYINSKSKIESYLNKNEMIDDFHLKNIDQKDEYLNLLWMKFNMAKLRYVALGMTYYNTDYTYCGFHQIDIQSEVMLRENGQASIYLQEKYLGQFKDRYVNVQSVKHNGKDIPNPFKDSSLYIFHEFYAQDLQPGNYFITGEVDVFVFDNKKLTFDFDHTFEAK